MQLSRMTARSASAIPTAPADRARLRAGRRRWPLVQWQTFRALVVVLLAAAGCTDRLPMALAAPPNAVSASASTHISFANACPTAALWQLEVDGVPVGTRTSVWWFMPGAVLTVTVTPLPMHRLVATDWTDLANATDVRDSVPRDATFTLPCHVAVTDPATSEAAPAG